jgi:hypothetical protein
MSYNPLRLSGLAELARVVGYETAREVYWLLDRILPTMRRPAWRSPTVQAQWDHWLNETSPAAGGIALVLITTVLNRALRET